LDHGAEQRLDCGRGRLGVGGRVVDLDRGDRAARHQDSPGLAQNRKWIGDVLQEPHHPDVVERLVRERERERVSLQQGCLDPGPLEVPAGEVELLRLDVDAGQADARELLSEHREHCTDAAADLEQACPGLELGAVADQPVPPVLRLLD
jgi:hypothetical protein